MKKLLASILWLGWLALALSGGSSGQPEVNEPAATARLARAQALATRMAPGLQATLRTSTERDRYL
ncbi:MAG TPA: hypothetical protein VF498_13710 [Anaerolineales bacterium]